MSRLDLGVRVAHDFILKVRTRGCAAGSGKRFVVSVGQTEPSLPDDVDAEVSVGEGILVVLHSPYEAEIGRVFRNVCSPQYGYRTLLGRSDSCDCVLREGSVSRVHLSIEAEDGQLYLVDRCSTYGTFLNNDGRAIEREPLRSGDRIRAGSVVLKYFAGDDAESMALQALGQLAFTDPLTGGLKPEAFVQKLRRRIASEPSDRLFVFCVELRDLAYINEQHGSIAGDMLLAELAQRIRDAAGDQGYVARVDDNRFLALKLCPASRDPLSRVGHALRALPMCVHGQSVYPELIVKAVDAAECLRVAPEELVQRVLDGEQGLQDSRVRTSSGLICLGTLDTDDAEGCRSHC